MSPSCARTALIALLAVGFVGASVPEADAKSKKSKSAKVEKSKKSKKSKKSAKAPAKKANMPNGWTWPPSRAMRQAGSQCLDDLTAMGVKWERGKKTKKIATPVVVPDMEFGGVKVKSWWRKGPHVIDCHLALALAHFAPQLHALGVREIKFSSLYRYDHVTSHGVKRKTLSRHALGLAMDVRSFTDAAGNEAIVVEDYNDGNELLLRIEQFFNESGGFRTVLTPRNDPASHDDHFHIEVKVDYAVEAKKPNT